MPAATTGRKTSRHGVRDTSRAGLDLPSSRARTRGTAHEDELLDSMVLVVELLAGSVVVVVVVLVVGGDA